MTTETPPNEDRLGRYVTTVAFNETVSAYVPLPLPLPPSPPLVFSNRLLGILSLADQMRDHRQATRPGLCLRRFPANPGRGYVIGGRAR
ncbi:hypothetical protein [Aromatoleum anaerobium]|uniref:Uncharacterized protein n=1 Tax=Aromatoleum anaerobium TaxID=182180 RepID=A0ABX1PQ42_9RHOO|nr:hypothetical protein [Aromatoleum anaerobium]MCK0505732.1 hypothetical protein [Aromatoleum anaerobium]